MPVSPTGTATFDVEIYVGDPVNVGSEIFSMAQAAQVVIASYQKSYAANRTYLDSCEGSGPSVFDDETEHWVSGDGSDYGNGTSWDGECSDPVNYSSGTEDLSSYTNNLPVTWENASESEGDDYGTTMTSIKTTVKILPSGQQGIGQSALCLVQAQVINEDTGLQLPASAVQFMHQLAGTTSEDVTNSDGSVWSEAMVSVPAGAANVEVTPKAAGNYSFNNTCLAKTKEDWQAQVRTDIALNNGGINIQYYLASNSFLSNRKYIKAVYSFYQMVYLEQPTEYYWCGLAKLAGAPVYAGLSDAQNVGLLTGFQQTIMQMNINILNDLAWQFEAYRKGGLQALEAIYAVDVGHTSLDLNAITAWREIDQGIQQNNQSLILQGNQDLLKREQQQVLPPSYALLSTFDTVLMSIFAKCPVWNSSDVPYYLRDFNTIMTSLGYGSFNIATTSDRWTWITDSTFGIWDTWVNLSSSDKTSQVSVPLTTRAVTYSTLPSILFNY